VLAEALEPVTAPAPAPAAEAAGLAKAASFLDFIPFTCGGYGDDEDEKDRVNSDADSATARRPEYSSEGPSSSSPTNDGS
jgi:hypothetical protein